MRSNLPVITLFFCVFFSVLSFAKEVSEVEINNGEKRIFLKYGYITGTKALIWDKSPGKPKAILRGWNLRLYTSDESKYYEAKETVWIEPRHHQNVVVVRGSSAWVVGADGKLYSLEVNGRKLEEWTGRWALFEDAKYYFIYSIRTTDSKTFTYKLNSITEKSELIDEAFRPLISNLNSASDIPGISIPALKAEISALRAQTDQDTNFPWFLKESGVKRLAEVEVNRNLLISTLRKHIYGQEKLIDGLAELRSVSLMDPGKKVFSAIMMGPSGTGKTFSASVFAEHVFGSSDYVLTIDGTEFQQPIRTGSIEIHKLVGAPDGQQGMQKGQVTEWLKKTKGNGILIINEGDKMHPDVWMRFMELLDRGEITSGSGEKIKANFLYIVITTNRGTKRLFPSSIKSWSDEQITRRVASTTESDLKELYENSLTSTDNTTLPREVINRVDVWLLSQPLSSSSVKKIALSEANKVIYEMSEMGLEVEVDEDVIDYLALTGFKATDDGRQVRRAVRKNLADLFREVGKTKIKENTKVQVSLHKGALGKYYLQARGIDLEVNVLGPQPTQQSPLFDQKITARLQNIPVMIEKRVMGQSEAVKSVSEALIAKLGQSENDRATSLFFIGTSGNGKTELGRAIAEAGYGSIDNAIIIPLGEVQNEADFNKVLGVQPGYVGSDQTRAFEDALMANPNGGVIIFDEASNMGGADKNRKSELFKKLYNLVEEKSWTSPVNGRVYDLSKYVFVFTGNDGEEYFQGLTADDMLLKTWSDLKPREKVRELLRAAGVPQAFINRMADIILLKPILSFEAQAITQKLFSAQVLKYQENNPGISISYDEAFIKQLASSFFTKDKGGRSIRDIVDHRLNALLTLALIKHGIPETGFNSVTIKLGLTDNKTLRPYRLQDAPPRKVELQAIVTDSTGRATTQNIDLTEFSSSRMLMGIKEARATAFHEAGHAVVNDPGLTSKRLGFVTILGGRARDTEYLGYARYELLPGKSGNMTHESAVAMIAQLSAGRVAQSMAGYPEDSGYLNDLETIRTVATKYFTEWGLGKDFLAIQVDKDRKPQMTGEQSALLQQKMELLIQEGETLAKLYLQQNWDLVRATVAALFKNGGNINGEQFESIQNSFFSRKPRKTYKDFLTESKRRLRLRPKTNSNSCRVLLGDLIRKNN